MASEWDADGLIDSPSENVGRYKRNFLRQAVCELRFPTLMELGEPKPPSSFVKALRLDYPYLDLANEVTIGIGGGVPGSNNTHIFRSAKLNWTVSLKQSTISIETTAYPGFESLKAKVMQVVEAASEIIDTDFFTRIGLRYVNVIASDSDPVQGWVNPNLVAAISPGQFSGIREFGGKINLSATDGGCTLQHGVNLTSSSRQDDIVLPEYVLDIDVYRNQVEVSDTAAVLDAMHSQAFDLFDWAIGPEAREFLSSDKTTSKTPSKK